MTRFNCTATSAPGALAVREFQSPSDGVAAGRVGVQVERQVEARCGELQRVRVAHGAAVPLLLGRKEAAGKDGRVVRVRERGHRRVRRRRAPERRLVGRREMPTFKVDTEATVTFAVAVTPIAAAVTVTTPNVVPVGVRMPLPAPTLAMSRRSMVQLALAGSLVPSASVAVASSAWVGTIAGFVTVSVALAGVS